MTQSSRLRWGRPEAPLPLQIMATTWPPTDEIDACNGDLVVAITEFIAGHTILTGNHLISPEIYLDSILRHQKTWGKGWVPSHLVSSRRAGEEEREEPWTRRRRWSEERAGGGGSTQRPATTVPSTCSAPLLFRVILYEIRASPRDYPYPS